MTYSVPRSKLHGVQNFDDIVRVHADNLRAYDIHSAAVARGEADPYPPPHAPMIVEKCIRRQDYARDYRIIEDMMPPTLAARAVRSLWRSALAIGIAFTLSLALIGLAGAQSNPGLVFGQVPTAAQWNSYFSAKQDVLGYTPVNKGGDTMLGGLVTVAAATSGSGFRLPHGVAPTTPTNGDMWTTTSGLFVRINGSTQGPFGSVPNGTSGGIPYYSNSTTLTSSGVLSANNPVLGGGAGASPISGARSGSTTTFATTGTLTVGQCVTIDGSLNLVGAGGACTTGGGGGTVNVGSANQLAYYPGAAATVSGLATANNGVLVTSGGGVPSISSTLPSALAIPSPTFTGTVAGANTIPFGVIAQLASTSLLGNPTGSTANLAGITIGATLTFSGSTLQTTAHTGDVTTAANSFATTIANSAVTNAKLANAAANTWKGNASGSAGVLTDNAWVNCNNANSAVIYTANAGTGCNTALVSLSATGQTFSGGTNITANNRGTQSSGTFTVDCSLGPLQYLTNNGAFILAPPANDSYCTILITNGASAGAITAGVPQGWAIGTSTGDPVTTSNTQKFAWSVIRINGQATYRVAALQ